MTWARSWLVKRFNSSLPRKLCLSYFIIRESAIINFESETTCDSIDLTLWLVERTRANIATHSVAKVRPITFLSSASTLTSGSCGLFYLLSFFWVSRSFLYNFPALSVFGIILIWLSKTWAKCALSRVKSLRSLIKRAMSCYRFAHWALPVCRFSVTHVCLVTFCSVWCKTINAINKLCPVCLKCKTGNGAGDSFAVKVITCTTRSWSF